MVELELLTVLLPLLTLTGIFGAIGSALGAVSGIADLFGGGDDGDGGLEDILGAVGGGLGGLLSGGGLGGAGLGALGGLLGGGGVQGALLGTLLGGSEGEKEEARKALEESVNARQELLRRNLGFAEQSFAGKAPLRNLGLSQIGQHFAGGQARSAFFPGGGGGTPTVPGASDPFAALGALAPQSGNLLFGGQPGGGGSPFGAMGAGDLLEQVQPDGPAEPNVTPRMPEGFDPEQFRRQIDDRVEDRLREIRGGRVRPNPRVEGPVRRASQTSNPLAFLSQQTNRRRRA